MRAVPAEIPPKDALKTSSSPTAKGTGANRAVMGVVAVRDADVSDAGWAGCARVVPAASSESAPTRAPRIEAVRERVMEGVPGGVGASLLGNAEKVLSIRRTDAAVCLGSHADHPVRGTTPVLLFTGRTVDAMDNAVMNRNPQAGQVCAATTARAGRPPALRTAPAPHAPDAAPGRRAGQRPAARPPGASPGPGSPAGRSGRSPAPPGRPPRGGPP